MIVFTKTYSHQKLFFYGVHDIECGCYEQMLISVINISTVIFYQQIPRDPVDLFSAFRNIFLLDISECRIYR